MATDPAKQDPFTRLRTRLEPHLATSIDKISPHLPDRVNAQLSSLPIRRTIPGSETSYHPLPSDPQPPPPAALRDRDTVADDAPRLPPRPPSSGVSTPRGVDIPEKHKAIQRASSLSWSPSLAELASKILYRTGQCPVSGGPLLILNAAAFPDPEQIDYNKLLPYVLANLPGENELEGTDGYGVVFFAGGGSGGSGGIGLTGGGGRPSWTWMLQAYHLLGRAVRKKIKRLWVVHEKAWVRVMLEVMAGVVSGKARKKVIHVANLTELATLMPIQRVLIPPSAYLTDRKLSPAGIVLPSFPPSPVFGRPPFPPGGRFGDPNPLPDVLVDATNFLRLPTSLATEGLFRIPASAAYIEILKDAYDRRQAVRWSDWGPQTAAGLIKLYYRLLPDPVIPVTVYDELPIPGVSPEEEIEMARKTVEMLNPDGLVLLRKHLIPLLRLVRGKERENKMSAKNLAVCVAGSLVRSDDVLRDAGAGEGARRLVQLLIERDDVMEGLGRLEVRPGTPKDRPVEGRKWDQLVDEAQTLGEAAETGGLLEKGGIEAAVTPVSSRGSQETTRKPLLPPRPVPEPITTAPTADIPRPSDSPRRKPVPSPTPASSTSSSRRHSTASPTVVISPDPATPATAPAAADGLLQLPRRATLAPQNMTTPTLHRKLSAPLLPTFRVNSPSSDREELKRVGRGEFQKPTLRRVVSNGGLGVGSVGRARAGSNVSIGGGGEEGDGDGGVVGPGGRGLRRVRSSGVKELRGIFEERARG